jgi:cell division protein ZapB
MEPQINSLEIKLRQMLELCQSLRSENQKLRQQIAIANDHNKQLSERVIYARTRMESLLSKIPGADL